MLDAIEQSSPELVRLRDKLERLDAWLDDHPEMIGTEKYAHRQDVWFSTERKYRAVYDRTRLERTIEQVKEAEARYQERML